MPKLHVFICKTEIVVDCLKKMTIKVYIFEFDTYDKRILSTNRDTFVYSQRL